MCTVTIIPKGNNDFVLTTNRDEAPDRVSLVPDFYTVDETKLLFPKDKKGGTWIGVSEKNRVICVLNGGFNFHKRKENYRKSRGIVANDFMVSNNIIGTIKAYNLNDIEPFTMIMADWNADLKFLELVWDGHIKHFKQLPLATKIWSSSSLYNESMRNERQQWFEDFKTNNELHAKSVLNFHKTAGSNNDDYGVIMNRGFVKTTSITQVEKLNDTLKMCYENLQNNDLVTINFILPQIVND